MRQFQDEATISVPKDTVPPDEATDQNENLALLVLGVRLRGSLTESDRAQWERLAPDDRQVFLRQGDRLLHPAEGVPFPPEHIDGCSGHGAALFSHRYQPDKKPNGHAYRIQTAILNPGRPNPLLYGWFGPEPNPLHCGLDDRFGMVVQQLRHVCRQTEEPLHRLSELLAEPVPTLVIARRSGCTLCGNDATADLAGLDQTEMVGLRLAQIQRLCGPTPSDQRLTMQHLSAAEIELTVITIGPAATATHPDDRFVADLHVHPMHRMLTGIAPASGSANPPNSEAQ